MKSPIQLPPRIITLPSESAVGHYTNGFYAADALWLEAVKPLVKAAWGVLGWRHTDPPTNTLRGLAEALAPFAESHETIKARRAKKEESDA